MKKISSFSGIAERKEAKEEGERERGRGEREKRSISYDLYVFPEKKKMERNNR